MTDGTLVGIQVEGNGHYLHDIGLENFAVGVDIYASNTKVLNVATFGTIAGNAIGIRATGCFELDVENLGAFSITSTGGTAVALSFTDCRGIYVNDAVIVTKSAFGTKGIQILDSEDVYVGEFVLSEQCNPTGIEVTRSSNIRFYSGVDNVDGCSSDTSRVVGMSIDNSSDVMISKLNSTITTGPLEAVGITASSSQYIALSQSNVQIVGFEGIGGVTNVYLNNTIGFTVENSSFTGYGVTTGNQSSTGLQLDGESQLGIHFCQIDGVAAGVIVSNTSDFYANSIASTARITYNLPDTAQCTSESMNADVQSACYPPSAKSCCNATCNMMSSAQGSCARPEITSILGLPFQTSGAFITILGNNFGDNYFDTVVQFNDTLCLIHEKTDTMIVCWISGDSFNQSTYAGLIGRVVDSIITSIVANVTCEVDTDCASNICYEGECVVETIAVIVAGQDFNVTLDLGNNNTVIISIAADTFPPGYVVQALSRSPSRFFVTVEGYVRIVDLEFYVLDTMGQIIDNYSSPILFSFDGPDVRTSEKLYVGFNDTFSFVGSATLSSLRALFNVTRGGNGVFALMAPAPAISNITRAPTSGGRIVISGSNLGTSGDSMIVAVTSPSQKPLFCPVHVATALVSENSIECNLPAGVGQNLTLSIFYYFPGSSVIVSAKYSYQAPTISSVRPTTIFTSQLAGLRVTVSGSNFGASDANNRSLAPVFAPSFGGQICSDALFLVTHQIFTCQLGTYANESQFRVVVGDIGPDYSQVATYNMSIARAVPAIAALSIAAPARVCVGTSFGVNVTAFDRFGRIVPGYVSIDLAFSSSDPSISLPNSTVLVRGLQTFFGFVFSHPGDFALTVSSTFTQPATTNVTVLDDVISSCARSCDTGTTRDACGVCGGNNSTCQIECESVNGTRLRFDACGVCGGNNATCTTCNSTVDKCGVCGGNGSSCAAGTEKDGDDHHVGAIVGGTIGGFVGLLIAAGAIAFFVRHRRFETRPPPNFTITGRNPGNNVKFGISDFGTGYSNHGLTSPILQNMAAPFSGVYEQ